MSTIVLPRAAQPGIYRSAFREKVFSHFAGDFFGEASADLLQTGRRAGVLQLASQRFPVTPVQPGMQVTRFRIGRDGNRHLLMLGLLHRLQGSKHAILVNRLDLHLHVHHCTSQGGPAGYLSPSAFREKVFSHFAGDFGEASADLLQTGGRARPASFSWHRSVSR